jgi:hypothetical protein
MILFLIHSLLSYFLDPFTRSEPLTHIEFNATEKLDNNSSGHVNSILAP